MADISSSFTVVQWLNAQAEPYIDLSDEFIYSVLLNRGITDDETLLSDITEEQRDLCRADVYYAAATSSVKTGTQGESDGGWTHYIAIKNTVRRDVLLAWAKALYDKWDEDYLDPSLKITMKPLY